MFETFGMKSSLRYLASAVAAWYFYKQFIKPFLSPLRKIPGRPYIPFIGNMLEIMKKGANTNGLRWMQMYNSRIVRFYFLGGEGALLVGDPEMAKYILVTNSKNYHRGNNSRTVSSMLPGFILLLNGDAHHALRRVLNPVFSSHAIEGYIPSFESIGRKLISKWSEKIDGRDGSGVIEAQDYMTRLTLDAICECGFDYDMKSLDNKQSPEVKAFNHILGGLELSMLRLLNLNWLPTKRNRRIWSDMHTYKSCITQVISTKQEKMETQKDLLSKDILTQLLQAKDESGKPLSKDMLYAQVGGFLFAGYETTSTTLTWTLLELARRPEVQDKVRQEVMKSLPDKSSAITPDLVKDLMYLTAVIKESLRLNPPASTIFRRTVSGDYLGGYYVPAGTLVGINLGALHRLPELWTDPEEFKPERFLESYDKYAFLPFSAGPYMCIGNQFSLAEAKVTLALILRHFTFCLPTDYKFKTVRKLTVQPSPPLQLVVKLLNE